ncbi:MAG: GNAT family N-acetyltransferase [Elusimicrobiales bacterium]
MALKHVEMLIDSGTEGREIRVRNARSEDARRIQALYSEVYGSSYSVSVVTDREKMKKAIASDDYFWLVGEHEGRIIASLFYTLDRTQRISKALGAVVSNEYRKLNLANTLMRFILDAIISAGWADVVYATTRTANTAPQQLTEGLGFAPLGIFPNAHKVFENETHCLAGHFIPQSWQHRRAPAVLLEELEPLHRLAGQSLAKFGVELEKPELVRAEDSGREPPVKNAPQIPFEIIDAPHFAAHRWRAHGNSGVFENAYVPFHEPNLILLSHDQKTEIYIHYSEKDGYSAILGGRSEEKDLSVILRSAANALRELKVSYVEHLVDAYSPQLQQQALHARFLPSAYFPAMRLHGGKRWDYIIFSHSFDMLDFRNVSLMPAYRQYLKQYLQIWDKLYIETALTGKK